MMREAATARVSEEKSLVAEEMKVGEMKKRKDVRTAAAKVRGDV